MIINIEWGAFTSKTLPKLDFDRDLDASSTNPGAMQLEKLTSGVGLFLLPLLITHCCAHQSLMPYEPHRESNLRERVRS